MKFTPWHVRHSVADHLVQSTARGTFPHPPANVAGLIDRFVPMNRTN
jgi:hypothetical protein